MAKSVEQWIKEYEKMYSAQKDKEIATSNELFETQKKTVSDNYNKQIVDTKNSYEDKYDENAIQKIVNERTVAENMANLGLTDSGLNRTQQTAIQLSYANQKGKIDIARQKAVDTLAAELANKVTEIDLNKISAADTISKNYYNSAVENAQKSHQAELEYEAKVNAARIQAAAEAAKSNYKYYKFAYSDNGTYYFYNSEGKKESYAQGVNPYTGTAVYGAKKLQKYGVWNGYQPKGVYFNGNDYGKVTLADANGISYQGHIKKIWSTTTKNVRGNDMPKKYWIWDDYKNGGSYIPVYYDAQNNEWYRYN